MMWAVFLFFFLLPFISTPRKWPRPMTNRNHVTDSFARWRMQKNNNKKKTDDKFKEPKKCTLETQSWMPTVTIRYNYASTSKSKRVSVSSTNILKELLTISPCTHTRTPYVYTRTHIQTDTHTKIHKQAFR